MCVQPASGCWCVEVWPRTYYLGIGQPAEDKIAAVCLVPRGAEEGATLEIDRDDLQLVANRPVSFRLYSSLTRTEDRPGQVWSLPPVMRACTRTRRSTP